ncbi:MAG: zinc-ribbon domain-containing protein [Candidatus Micrarchaeota archaeon]|nr:zinc-ribbon domain-containing protein [Candidatus Micrarchaeota archaeon]
MGEEINDIKEILGPNEKIEAEATQRRWGPGGELMTPITIIATDSKLIVINRTKMGMKKDYEIVQYGNIVSAKLINGFISASIIIRVRGYKISSTDEISGFITKDAKPLIDYINRKIGSAPSAPGVVSSGPVAGAAPATAASANQMGVPLRTDPDHIFCPHCGAKNLKNSKFCSTCGKAIVLAK